MPKLRLFRFIGYISYASRVRLGKVVLFHSLPSPIDYFVESPKQSFKVGTHYGLYTNDVLNTFNTALATVVGREKYVIIATVIYLVLFFAFASGLVNSIIEGSSARALVVPSRSIQSIGETIVTSIIFFLGFFGAYLLYESGRAMTVKKQWVFLVGGIVAIFVSIVLGLNLVRLKS